MAPKPIRLYAVTTVRQHPRGPETRTFLYRTRSAAERRAGLWRDMGRQAEVHVTRVATWSAA